MFLKNKTIDGGPWLGVRWMACSCAIERHKVSPLAAGTSGQGNITDSNSRLTLDFDARRKAAQSTRDVNPEGGRLELRVPPAFPAPSTANTRDYARLTANGGKRLSGDCS